MLTNFTVVIIPQYVCIPNHQVVHIKLIQTYISIISQKSWGVGRNVSLIGAEAMRCGVVSQG